MSFFKKEIDRMVRRHPVYLGLCKDYDSLFKDRTAVLKMVTESNSEVKKLIAELAKEKNFTEEYKRMVGKNQKQGYEIDSLKSQIMRHEAMYSNQGNEYQQRFDKQAEENSALKEENVYTKHMTYTSMILWITSIAILLFYGLPQH